MKAILKSLIKAALFLLIAAGVLSFLNELLREKWLDNYTWRDEEYKALPRESVDVLFVGSSHNYFTVNPAMIMEEEGVASFCMGTPSLRMNVLCEVLDRALRTQNPQAVFVEAYAFSYADAQQEAYLHYTFDGWPLSLGKWRSICRVTTPQQKELRKELILPLILYHSRWPELNMTDLEFALGLIDFDVMMGHYASTNIAEGIELGGSMIDRTYPDRIKEDDRQALLRMQEMCREKGIEMVLWKAPTPKWNKEFGAIVEAFAQEIGIPFYDFNTPDMLEQLSIDVATDFADNGHLNEIGSRKATAGLCSLIGRMEIAAHELTEEEVSAWDECVNNGYAKLEKCRAKLKK